MNTTEKYLHKIAKAKMDAIIFTPHFKRGFFYNTKEKILEVYQQVDSIVKRSRFIFRTYCAAEVYLKGELAITDIQENSFMINGSRYVLVENSMYGLSKDFFENLYSLTKLGYKPILAHPERYLEIQKNIELASELMHRDVYMQINTGSLLGEYGSKVKEIALSLVKSGYAHFLGSDCHCDLNKYSYLEAFELINKKFSHNIAHLLAKENPEQMLNNEDIPLFYQKTNKYSYLNNF